MQELDRFVVANPARIPCTVRTLRPYSSEGSNPFVHIGEIMDSILYLAARSGHPDTEIRALKEQLESVSCSIRNYSDSLAPAPVGNIIKREPDITEL